MLEAVADGVSELARAAPSDDCLVTRTLQRGLESFPRCMCRVAKLAVVRFELEILSSFFHAQGLRWLGLILRGTLNKVSVLLLSLMENLNHVLAQHGLIRGAKFMCVRRCILERLLRHYFMQNRLV